MNSQLTATVAVYRGSVQDQPKPINTPEWVKEAHKPSTPVQELFTADGFQSRDSNLSLVG